MYKGCYISKSLKKSEKFLYWVFLIQSVEPRFHLPPFLHMCARKEPGSDHLQELWWHMYHMYIYVCMYVRRDCWIQIAKPKKEKEKKEKKVW